MLTELRELVFLRSLMVLGLVERQYLLKKILEGNWDKGSIVFLGFAKVANFLNLEQWTSPSNVDSGSIKSLGLLGSIGPKRIEGSVRLMGLKWS